MTDVLNMKTNKQSQKNEAFFFKTSKQWRLLFNLSLAIQGVAVFLPTPDSSIASNAVTRPEFADTEVLQGEENVYSACCLPPAVKNTQRRHSGFNLLDGELYVFKPHDGLKHILFVLASFMST